MAIFHHNGYNNLQRPTTTYNNTYNALQQLLQQNLQQPTTLSTTNLYGSRGKCVNLSEIKTYLLRIFRGTDRKTPQK